VRNNQLHSKRKRLKKSQNKNLRNIFFKGVYCVECYYEIFQTCRLCHEPIGLNSDVSDCEYYIPDIDSIDNEDYSSFNSSKLSELSISESSKTPELDRNSNVADTVSESISDSHVNGNLNSFGSRLSSDSKLYKMDTCRIRSVIDESLRSFYKNIECKNDLRDGGFMEIFLKNDQEFKNNVADDLRNAVFANNPRDLADFVVWNFLKTVKLSDYFDENLLEEDLFLEKVANADSFTSFDYENL